MQNWKQRLLFQFWLGLCPWPPPGLIRAPNWPSFFNILDRLPRTHWRWWSKTWTRAQQLQWLPKVASRKPTVFYGRRL